MRTKFANVYRLEKWQLNPSAEPDGTVGGRIEGARNFYILFSATENASGFDVNLGNQISSMNISRGNK